VSPTADGLVAALDQLVATTRRRTGVGASVSCPEVLDELDAGLAEDVYFIVAEAVHNAIKHAGATDITILGRHDAAASTVELVVADDGCGFDGEPERWEGGYGLTSMRERAGRWGGSLTVDSAVDRGTRVTLCVPQDVGRGRLEVDR